MEIIGFCQTFEKAGKKALNALPPPRRHPGESRDPCWLSAQKKAVSAFKKIFDTER
jgi:hypothetical protein